MNYTFTTDDKDEAAMLAYASEAWATLSDVRNTLRNHFKYEEVLDIDALYNEVCETLSRIEL